MLQLIATLAVLAALLGTAERLDPEAGVRTVPDSTQRRIDLAWMGVYVIYAPAAGSAASVVIRTAGDLSSLEPRLAAHPWVVRLAGAAIVAELVAYAVHRTMHAVPLLWRVHSVHHRATDLRWWTAFRFHPAETVLMHIMPYAVAALLGFGTDVIVVHLGTVTVVTIFAHADVYLPGRLVAALIVTPGYHRSHHEIGRDNTNFALVLPLVDVVFGTASFVWAAPRRFGCPEPAGQPTSSAPSVSDVRLASELEVSAVVSSRSQYQTMVASSRITPISTATSDNVRAASCSSSGRATRNASGWDNTFTKAPTRSARDGDNGSPPSTRGNHPSPTR